MSGGRYYREGWGKTSTNSPYSSERNSSSLIENIEVPPSSKKVGGYNIRENGKSILSSTGSSARQLRDGFIAQVNKLPACANCLKKTLISLNVLFLIVGILAIAIGAYSVKKLHTISSLINSTMPIALIVIGVLVVICCIFGFFGACLENRKLLLVYFFIILALFISQLVIGLISYENRNGIGNQLRRGWELISDADKVGIQTEFHCCGFWNITDDPGSNCSPTDLIGCGSELISFWKHNLTILGVVGIIVASIQGASIIFSIILYFCIRCTSGRSPLDQHQPSFDSDIRRLVDYEDDDT